MVPTIVLKEIRGHILSLRFAATCVFMLCFVTGGMVMMAKHYHRQLDDYDVAKKQYRELIREVEVQELEEYTVQKRPNPLMVFAAGMEGEMSRPITVTTNNETRVGGVQHPNPMFRLFSTPDLAYVVNVIGSLLALLLVFDAISGERERGTLKLVLSNAVPRDIVLIGKWIGGYVMIVVSFLMAFVLGLIAVSMLNPLSLDGEQWGRVGLIFGTALLYMGVFCALGIAISSWTHSSATSLVVSFFLWVVLVLAIPNVMPIVARQMVSAPTVGALDKEKQAIYEEEMNTYRERRRELPKETDRVVKRRRFRELFNEAMRHIRERQSKVMQAYSRKIDRRAKLARTLSRISPAASYLYAGTLWAGTGVEDFWQMRSYVSTFKEQFIRTAEDAKTEVSVAMTRAIGQGTDEVNRVSHWKMEEVGTRLPIFHLEGLRLEVSSGACLTDLLALVIWGVLFLSGAYLTFMRYRP